MKYEVLETVCENLTIVRKDDKMGVIKTRLSSNFEPNITELIPCINENIFYARSINMFIVEKYNDEGNIQAFLVDIYGRPSKYYYDMIVGFRKDIGIVKSGGFENIIDKSGKEYFKWGDYVHFTFPDKNNLFIGVSSLVKDGKFLESKLLRWEGNAVEEINLTEEKMIGA